ncbi:MAG: pyridoxal phosphate-dependent aminotransferase [Alphaproteobacteria bacterium]
MAIGLGANCAPIAGASGSPASYNAMTIKVSTRGSIPPFIVMDVMRAANDRAAKGHDVVHLEVGQPSTSAPEAVKSLAKAALDSENLGYTEAFGLPALRARCAAYYREIYDTDIDASKIAMTTGSSGAFVLAFLAAFDAGDRIAFAAPGYPGYRNILTALDIEPVAIPVGHAQGFQISIDLLERLETPIDGLILASPANPTGAMIDPVMLKQIANWCAANGVRLVSDEIYHGITYGTVAETMAEINPDAIVINSLSKYFSMTGWRLGWMIVPDDLIRTVECLAQNLFISPPTLSQHAALAVFDSRKELDANVARYADNRKILLEGLPQCGFGPFAPADGAFYVYAGIGDLDADSAVLCRRMLEEMGVATTPGKDFDLEDGHRFVRFSYAGSSDEMRDAIARLKAWKQKP